VLEASVYIHFPWCLRKCPYCDFATSPLERDAIPHAEYASALLAELEMRMRTLGGARLVSVFFGGGTPSLWAPRELGRVLDGVLRSFGATPSEVEITVECNPSSLERTRARELRLAGVNRLSVGVQSLDDAELRFLGRLHDRALALTALDAAQSELTRVSADLMFALPNQPEERFYGYVDTLLARGLSHVSAYALTIEPATKFGADHRAGLLQAAPDESYARMYEGVERRFLEAGFEHYEVSNYARPGEESVHNRHYWRGGSYLGLGAAAVGCLAAEGGARRYRNHPDPVRYMARAPTPEVEVFEERLDAQDLIREALMLGLRMREGVDLARLRARTEIDPLAARGRALERRLARGDVTLDGDVLRVPPHRWLMLDGIVADLF
jgi:putative oxygen-independent coproporphyrinogen III oxidase